MQWRTVRSPGFQRAFLSWLYLVLTGTLLAGEVNPTNSAAGGNPLSDAEIKTMLRDYIDTDKLGVGLVVGIVDQQGTHLVSYGKLDNGTDAEVNGDTEFDIGSVTKVFTGLLLQDMVDRGEMNLNDPLQKYLPASVKAPTYHGQQITLLDLATHTSGLPREGKDYGNLYISLTNCVLQRAPGTQWEYSNFGMALLGQVIALKAGKDYETLLAERICRPLGMASTGVSLTPEERARLAIGHSSPDQRVPGIGIALYPGAGEMHSTANDLLKFISAYCGLSSSPLSTLMQRAEALHTLQSGKKCRLIWGGGSGGGGGTTFEHGGVFVGYQTELAFDVKRRRGVVVLSNCFNGSTFVPGIWAGLLNGCSPMPADTLPADPALYDRYTGLYRMGKHHYLTVRHLDQRLMLQALDPRALAPSFEVFPVSEQVFRNEFWEVQATFQNHTNNDSCDLICTSLGSLSGFSGSFEFHRVSLDIYSPPASVFDNHSFFHRLLHW